MMEFIGLFTKITGRVGRGGFWLGLIVLAVVGSSLALPAVPSIFDDNPLVALRENWNRLGLYGAVLTIALLYPLMALVIKRLHDRGKSGWRAALLWVPALVQIVSPLVGQGWLIDRLTWGYNLLFAQMLAVGVGFFIELGFYSGTRGANKYGPDPRDD